MGNLCHSTSACHWTRDKTQGTSLRENSLSDDQERVGKAVRPKSWRPRHVSAALLSRVLKIRCYRALCVCVLRYA